MRILCALSIFSVFLFSEVTAADFEVRLAVPTASRPSFSIQEDDPIGIKLSPELRSSARSNGTFLGVTIAGEAVIDLKSTTRSDLDKNLRALNGNVISSSTPITIIRRLIVFVDKIEIIDGPVFHGLDIIDRHVVGRFIVLEKASAFTANELRALAGNSNVRYVEPSFPRFIQQQAPNDRFFESGDMWALKTINISNIWKRSTSSDIVVAVIDTGVDMNHADLKPNILTSGYNFIKPDELPHDDHGHGTHVAGIIGAVGNNNIGITGIAWSVKILPLKVFPASGERLDPAFDVDIVKAIDYAIAKNAKIINNSWAGPNFSFAIKEAINRAETAEILFIAAASNDYGNNNDHYPRYPSSYGNSNIISVQATDLDDALSPFSNFGPTSVHMAAPGSAIWSTSLNQGYSFRSGTSQAAPHVAGAAALLWSLTEYRQKTARQIKDVLLSRVRPVTSLADRSLSGGVLDLSFVSSAAIASTGQLPQVRRKQFLLPARNTSPSNDDSFTLDKYPMLSKIINSLQGEQVTVTSR